MLKQSRLTMIRFVLAVAAGCLLQACNEISITSNIDDVGENQDTSDNSNDGGDDQQGDQDPVGDAFSAVSDAGACNALGGFWVEASLFHSGNRAVSWCNPADATLVERADYLDSLLDAENQLNLPRDECEGADSADAALLSSGSVNQDQQSFLDDDQIGNGFLLSCVAFPTSNLSIEFGVEERL
jgi:ferredoxin